mgnify:CR=1 FL=1
MDENVLVQPIIVVPDVPRNYLISCAAQASLKAFKTLPSDRWAEWTSGGHYRKTVRKVKASQLETMTEELGLAKFGCAAASVPMKYPEFPKKIASAQVSGWDDKVFPVRDMDSMYQSGKIITIYLNSALGMSAGKSAAQAAHALIQKEISYPGSTEGKSVRIIEADISEKVIGELKDAEGRVRIYDAGLTEIPEGSLTAVIFS